MTSPSAPGHPPPPPAAKPHPPAASLRHPASAILHPHTARVRPTDRHRRHPPGPRRGAGTGTRLAAATRRAREGREAVAALRPLPAGRQRRPLLRRPQPPPGWGRASPRRGIWTRRGRCACRRGRAVALQCTRNCRSPLRGSSSGRSPPSLPNLHPRIWPNLTPHFPCESYPLTRPYESLRGGK